MAKHTPGPWEVHEAKHADGEFWASIGQMGGRGPITDIVGAEGHNTKWFKPVAGMKYLVTPVGEQAANARLIAAAPEMLDALNLAAGYIGRPTKGGFDGLEDHDAVEHTVKVRVGDIKKILGALARAKGGAS